MQNIDTLNDDLLSVMLTHDERYLAQKEKTAFDLVHVIDDVYLARGKAGDQVLPSRSCSACPMNAFRCANIDKTMPCLPGAKIGLEGYTAIRAQAIAHVQTVAMPTNGKKKNEYVPDTAANFDFSESNWKSVRSMIGM